MVVAQHHPIENMDIGKEAIQNLDANYLLENHKYSYHFSQFGKASTNFTEK